jgi:hypothetical protein
VEEVYAISEPFINVLCLVDGDKLEMGYFFEVMGGAKESIYALLTTYFN